MAVSENTRVAPFGALTIYHIVSKVGAIGETFTDWNAQRKTEKALYALSERELEDIGLCRGDIHGLAKRFR